MHLLSDVLLIFALLGNDCQPLLGGGVKVIQLTRRAKLGNQLEIECRAEPGERAGLPVVLSWRWISNGAVVELDHNRLPPGAEKLLTITNRFQDIGFTFIASVVSRIQWTAVPKEASGIYHCRDSNDVSQSTSNTTLIVSTASQHDDWHSHGRIQDQENKVHIFQSGSTFNLTCFTSDKFGQAEWLGPQSVEDDEYYYREKEIPLRFRWSKQIKFKRSTSILIVQNASYLDTGYYTCYNKNNFNVIERQFVYVEDPQHLILPPVMQPVGQYRNLRVIGYYSESNVQVGCGPTHPSVRVILKKLDNEIKAIASSEKADGLNNDWSFNPMEGFKINMVDSWEMMGQYQCEATWSNSSKKSVPTKFKIEIHGLQVYSNFDPFTPIVEGDQITLTCRSKNKEVMDLAWRWLPAVPLPYQTIPFMEINTTHLPADGKGYLLPFENETSDQEYPPPLETFQVHRLKWTHFPVEANGIYQCYDANNLIIPVSNITVNVAGSIAPVIIDSEEEKEIDVYPGNEFSLECRDNSAFPKPKIQWFMRIRKKPAEEILDDGRTRYHDINTTDDGRNSVLVVSYASTDTTYCCQFRNFKGSTEKCFHVMLIHGLGGGIIAAVAVAAFVVVVIILLALFLKRFYKQKVKQMHQELIINRLKLLEGNVERINPHLPLEDQVDLLPYDNKYEFPSSHLVLGKQLGVGEFGRVVQAKAVGMGLGNRKVAVKMVKSALDNTGLTSLASELKIRIHLGSHLNVVSLLGACTKNIIQGELMVIVEFCAYGNLQDFLMTNRRHFVNELDLNGDPSPFCPHKADPQLAPQLVQNMHAMKFASPDKSAVKSTPIEVANGDNDCNPRYWSPNCSKKESRSPIVCTRDLIEWSYQIACGMNYLTRRKVLHGDLAARNVLLADDNIVKIADFGLSRKVYKNSIYQKQGQEALPIKWMAIESLIDRVFSSQSDVWSYGVTIWELFSLSKHPYPEVNELEDLIRFLQSGRRMERPELMPRAIGNVIEDCWKHNQEERTTFARLEEILGEMVDPIIRQRFAGEKVMTEPNNYVKMNKKIGNNPEANSEYETMTSNENRQVFSVLNASSSSQRPNVPPKLYPHLNGTNYINASTEINTPPQTPMSCTNPRKKMSLSFQKSLADSSTQGYLAVLSATPV